MQFSLFANFGGTTKISRNFGKEVLLRCVVSRVVRKKIGIFAQLKKDSQVLRLEKQKIHISFRENLNGIGTY